MLTVEATFRVSRSDVPNVKNGLLVLVSLFSYVPWTAGTSEPRVSTRGFCIAWLLHCLASALHCLAFCIAWLLHCLASALLLHCLACIVWLLHCLAFALFGFLFPCPQLSPRHFPSQKNLLMQTGSVEQSACLTFTTSHFFALKEPNMITSLPPAIASSGLFASAQTSGASDSASGAASGPSFGQMLQSALGQVSGLQDHASQMTTAFAQGRTGDIHGVMIASEQATMALQLTTQIRNKAVDAYQEVMRMSM